MQRRRLLRRLRLPRELAADRRRHRPRARARDQLVEHGSAVAGRDRDRTVDRPHRAQARSHAGVHSRLRRRPAGIPAVESSIGTDGATWTARPRRDDRALWRRGRRSEEHTSELQSPCNRVCRLLLEKKKKHSNVLVAYEKEKKATPE